MKKFLLILLSLSFSISIYSQYKWNKLENAPRYRGKQDDIAFINENKGWYVNGSGKIYSTKDGGENWELIFNKPGTFFRCIGFIDSLVGFVGNIGTEYFPKVSDTIPLYKTIDGGKNWTPVLYDGPRVKGLCAIDIVKVPYSNHGVFDYKYHINAGGRVGGPSFLLQSSDNGNTWHSKSMEDNCGYILDIKFFNEKDGIICAATNTSFDKQNALILKTTDGGNTWENVYQSQRSFEITWKMSFPSKDIGYVTIQSYNRDSTVIERYLAKTTNGGDTWEEIDLTEDFKCREFGVGFINENIGWVGSIYTGYETRDGGKSWKKVDIGKAVNKIRIINSKNKFTCYAIGSNIYKLEIDKPITD